MPKLPLGFRAERDIVYDSRIPGAVVNFVAGFVGAFLGVMLVRWLTS